MEVERLVGFFQVLVKQVGIFMAAEDLELVVDEHVPLAAPSLPVYSLRSAGSVHFSRPARSRLAGPS
jgi:hypothetical protein